jgi:hypothetical protein
VQNTRKVCPELHDCAIGLADAFLRDSIFHMHLRIGVSTEPSCMARKHEHDSALFVYKPI